MVVSNDLVGFEIPALDLFVFTATEEIGMSFRERQTSDGRNVSSKSELQCIVGTHTGLGEVPNFDGSIGGSSGKESIFGVHSDGSYPAKV